MAAGGEEGRRAAACLSGIVLDVKDACAELAGVEEIAWAVRYLLAYLGRDRPVIMVWEDLHWASSTLLDMIDDVVDWLVEGPVLGVCVARLDLLEARPVWGGGQSCALALQGAALISQH